MIGKFENTPADFIVDELLILCCKLAPSAGVGALTASIVGLPPIVGAFQGAAIYSLTHWVADSIPLYVGKRTNLDKKASTIIDTALIGAAILVPTALTTYYAPDILNGVASLVGSSIVDPNPRLSNGYTIKWATNVIQPITLQLALRCLKKTDNNQQQNNSLI